MQICAGLEAAHAKGVVHRDIKPSNVILIQAGDKYSAKIVDFGIAKLREPDAQNVRTMTATGEFLGSPKYMSPEQCEGLPADHRSDIYSFGILMYETLTGSPPFRDENVFAIIEKHRNCVPEPMYITDSTKQLSNQLQNIVFQCLEKKPSLRYSGMAAVYNELLKAQALVSDRSGFYWPFLYLFTKKMTLQKRARLPGIVMLAPLVAILAFSFLVTISVKSFDIPKENRQIVFQLPDVVPELSVEESRADDKRYSLALSLASSQNGESSEEYIQTSEKAGDFFRRHHNLDLAMKYYGYASKGMSRAGMAKSKEQADLFIKQAECCVPIGYALPIQQNQLSLAILLLKPLVDTDDLVSLKIIEAIFLRAKCNLTLAAKSNKYSARSYLHSAESDFNWTLSEYRSRQSVTKFPAEFLPILIGTGDYFFERALTAVDKDAERRSNKNAEFCYKEILEQIAGNKKYVTCEISTLNNLAMTQVKRGDFKSAISKLEVAIRMQTENKLSSREDRSKILSNLQDAYFYSGDYANTLKVMMERIKN